MAVMVRSCEQNWNCWRLLFLCCREEQLHLRPVCLGETGTAVYRVPPDPPTRQPDRWFLNSACLESGEGTGRNLRKGVFEASFFLFYALKEK